MAESPLDAVRRLHAKLEKRKTYAQKWSDYYEGKRPLLFASPEFSQLSGGLFDGFSDNWCQVVPDAMVERLCPMGFRLEDGTLDKAAWRAWRASECDVEFGLAALEALLAGRSYVMVWRPDGVTTEITFEHSSQAIVEYIPGRRRVRKQALKVWTDGALDYAVLITPSVVYRFERRADGMTEWIPRVTGLARSEKAHLPNPMGEVFMVELPNRSRLRGKPRSEIETVAPLQDAINTIWAHLLTASDAIALPARVVLGMDRPTREITDDEGEVVGEEDLPIAPFRRDRLLWLEGRDASIAEFSAADLTNYTNVIEVAVRHVAAQTRTPASYLTGEISNVSADTLTATESGLVAKVQEVQRHLGAALREVMRLEALAAGEVGRAEALALGTVVWRDAQFRSDAQYADALTKFKAIGVPDEALWERIPGVTPDQIERWKTMRTDQAAAIVGGDLASMFGGKPGQADDEEGVPPTE
ncbi:phage portal protein [Streptomyces fungicidicus]|uniref:phage portal protein n=1 Tax=Streptomyces fungicidicus TaxID=68203 RepID=UPI003693BE4C